MGTKKKRTNSFYYRQKYRGLNYNVKNCWCPGDVLKEGDEEMLKVVKEFYQENDYPPSRGDIPIEAVCRLKGRFRTWKNVLLAAGLPDLNSADVQNKRKEVAKRKMEEHECNENDSKD